MPNNEKWIVYPLTDRGVNELVLPEGNIEDLRQRSKSSVETTGLLYGVVKGPSLYFLGNTILGEGDLTKCSFNPAYRTFHNEFMERVGRVQKGLVSILYHNHPRVPVDKCPPEYLERLKEEMQRGVFDYLFDYGTEPSLREAIAENSRVLSPEDITATPGRAHVLLSDTAREGHDLSHINAYKIGEDCLPGEVFKVVPLSSKPPKDHYWAGGVCSGLKRVYEELKEKYEARENK